MSHRQFRCADAFHQYAFGWPCTWPFPPGDYRAALPPCGASSFAAVNLRRKMPVRVDLASSVAGLCCVPDGDVSSSDFAGFSPGCVYVFLIVVADARRYGGVQPRGKGAWPGDTRPCSPCSSSTVPWTDQRCDRHLARSRVAFISYGAVPPAIVESAVSAPATWSCTSAARVSSAHVRLVPMTPFAPRLIHPGV